MQALPMVLAAGGSILQGIGGYQSGQYNKKVARANARTAMWEGMEEASRIRAAGRVATGRQLASQAESGFEVGTGSALDTLLESQTNIELQAMDRFRQARASAAGLRAQGALAGQQGNNALIQGLFGAASSVINMKSDYAAAGGGY